MVHRRHGDDVPGWFAFEVSRVLLGVGLAGGVGRIECHHPEMLAAGLEHRPPGLPEDAVNPDTLIEQKQHVLLVPADEGLALFGRESLGVVFGRCANLGGFAANESAEPDPLPLQANLPPEHVLDIAASGSCRDDGARIEAIEKPRDERGCNERLAYAVTGLDEYAVWMLEEFTGDFFLLRPRLNPQDLPHVLSRLVPVVHQVEGGLFLLQLQANQPAFESAEARHAAAPFRRDAS